MVELPVPVELDESSSDIELTLEVTEKSTPGSLNSVSKKCPKMRPPSTVDEEVADSLTNDLNSANRLIETVMDDDDDFDEFEVESTTCDTISQSCDKITSLETTTSGTDKTGNSETEKKHVSDSSTKVNGFSSDKTSDIDTSEDRINSKLNNTGSSAFESLLTNGSLPDTRTSKSGSMNTVSQKSVSEETKNSLTVLPIVDSCDKSIDNISNGNQLNGDIPKLHDGGSSTALKRVVDFDSSDSEDEAAAGSSCPPEKRAKMDDFSVPNGYGVSESSINSTATGNSKQKKTTARKSTGGSVMKEIARIVEAEHHREMAEGSEDTVRPVANGVVGSADDVDSVECVDSADAVENVDVVGTADGVENVDVVENVDAVETVDIVDSADGVENVDAVDKVDVADKIDEDDKAVADCVHMVTSSPDAGRQSPVDEKKYPIKFNPDPLSQEKFEKFFKTQVKSMSRQQLEEIVMQKCCEMISENSLIGELKKQFIEHQQTDVFRKQTIFNLEKQILQLQAVGDIFVSKAYALKENEQIASPTVVTRSVGLQVAFDANPYARFEAVSSSTRTNSVDEGRPEQSSAVNSKCTSKDIGQGSGSLSPSKSPRSSSADVTIVEKSQKSLPATNDTAINSKNDTVSSVQKSSRVQPENMPPPRPPVDDSIVDLTDLDDYSESPPKPTPPTKNGYTMISRPRAPSELPAPARHPAPLPPTPKSRTLPGWKLPPPKPNLKIEKNNLAIQMTWDLALTADNEPIDKYQIYAYQETTGVAPSVFLWKFVGDVESLDLPMACTLTQFVNGYTYHFAVRAVDKHGRFGAFSCAKSVAL